MFTRECNLNGLHSLWRYQLDWRIAMSSALVNQFETKKHSVKHYRFSDGKEYVEIHHLIEDGATIVLSIEELKAIGRVIINSTGIGEL